jgi:hypothetical protein
MPGALPGLGPPNPFAPGLGPGGGMHVGPGHPFFADRMRHPDLGPGGFGSGQPGPRWDPIGGCLGGGGVQVVVKVPCSVFPL